MEEEFERFTEKCLKRCTWNDEGYDGMQYTTGQLSHTLRKFLCGESVSFSTDLDHFTSQLSEKLTGMLQNSRFDALHREDKSMYVKASVMINDLYTTTDVYCSDDTGVCADGRMKGVYVLYNL